MSRYKSPKHRVVTPAKEVLKKRITFSKIEELREKYAKKQGNVCPICGRSLLRLRATLDHCHKTGYIRGVLCNNCNGLEGKLAGIIARIDVSKLGYDAIMLNIAKWVDPANLKHKHIHPNAETLGEQKVRQRNRASLLRKRKKTLERKVSK